MKDWKDEIIESIQNAERAEPREEAYSKIRQHLERGFIASESLFSWLPVAAAVVLLVGGNILFLSQKLAQNEPVNEYSTSNFQIISDYNIYQ